MKVWLASSVTRAEAIGWALTVPALGVIGMSGIGLVKAVTAIRNFPKEFQAPYSPLMSASVSMGEWWVGAAIAACGVVCLLALITKQRTWVRIAAPVVFGLLAWSVQDLYANDLREWLAAGALQKLEQLEQSPR